ncbi:MAG: hypothetical protein ACTH2O_15695, partial [Cellulosimicrobium funkei]
VLVLDEPTAALGVRQTAEVLNLIEKLRERGHAVVLISHQAGDLQAVADRILVLRLGRVHGEFAGDTSYEDLLAAMTGAVRPARPGGPSGSAGGAERERRTGGTGAVHR